MVRDLYYLDFDRLPALRTMGIPYGALHNGDETVSSQQSDSTYCKHTADLKTPILLSYFIHTRISKIQSLINMERMYYKCFVSLSDIST